MPSEVGGLLELAGDAADRVVVRSAATLHAAIAERVFMANGIASKPVQVVHDAVSRRAYAAAGALLRRAGRAGRTSVDAIIGSNTDHLLSGSRRGRWLVSAVNGITGDRLDELGSALHVPMSVSVNGEDVVCSSQSLLRAFPVATPRVAVFVHGLCESDESWRPAMLRRLQRTCGVTAVTVRYNTGLRISRSGRMLAQLLDSLCECWPVPVDELVLVGHSMGGLVIRAAALAAVSRGQPWPRLLRHVVMLGTPHHGSFVEKGAHSAASLLRAVPETRALADFIDLRSAGIRDLRHGYIRDEEWRDDIAMPPPPPIAGCSSTFIVACLTKDQRHPVGRALGDLLVRTRERVGTAPAAAHRAAGRCDRRARRSAPFRPARTSPRGRRHLHRPRSVIALNGRVTGAAASALIGFAFFVNMVGTTLPTPLYPLYEREYRLAPVVVTVIFAVYAVGVVAALLALGRMSDLVGRRTMLLPALLLSAASAAIFLVAAATWELYVARILSGLSAGIFTGTGTAMLVDLAAPERRTGASAFAVVVNLGGLGAGTLLSGVLAEYAPDPTRLPYIVDLALVAAALLCVAVTRETIEVRWDARPRLQLQRLRIPSNVRRLFAQASLVGVSGFAVSGLFGAVTPTVLVELLHQPSHALAGLAAALLFLASVVGQVGALRTDSTAALLGGCVALIAGLALLAAALIASSLVLLIIAALTAGAGQGLCIGGGLPALTSQAPAAQRGEVASTYFFVLYLGLIVPVVATGLLSQAAGLRTAGLVFTAVIGALVIAVTASLIRSPGRALAAGAE